MPRGVAGTAQHGTRSMYNYHRCRCELCLEAAREYARAGRERWVRECEVQGCGKVARGSRLCSMHGARVRRHGDVNANYSSSRGRRREQSGQWAGRDVSYAGMHSRVEQLYGSPRECARCGLNDQSRVYHWALNWLLDPVVVWDELGRPFSLSEGDYIRLCVPCHKSMDLEALSWRPRTTEDA